LTPISRLPLTPFAFFPSHHKFLIYFNLTPKCSTIILISLSAKSPPHPTRLLYPPLSPSPPPSLLHFMTSLLRPPFCFTAFILPTPHPTRTFKRAMNHLSHDGHLKSRDGQDPAFIAIRFMFSWIPSAKRSFNPFISVILLQDLNLVLAIPKCL
jgi:hypothetical protein